MDVGENWKLWSPGRKSGTLLSKQLKVKVLLPGSQAGQMSAMIWTVPIASTCKIPIVTDTFGIKALAVA